MNEEELLDEALDIFHRMRTAYCTQKYGCNGLLHRWPDFIEEMDELQRHADRAREQQANLAAIKKDGVK